MKKQVVNFGPYLLLDLNQQSLKEIDFKSTAFTYSAKKTKIPLAGFEPAPIRPDPKSDASTYSAKEAKKRK